MTTKRIGLALSGGGFRATLFHLGVARFLKHANLLGSVSHIGFFRAPVESPGIPIEFRP